MRALLTGIKTHLQTALAATVRPGDIFITEDERLLPESVRFPAIGLKDGDIENLEETSMRYVQDLEVAVIVYSQVLKPEASIMDANTGVLALEERVITALKSNRTVRAGLDRAFPVRQRASVLFGDEERMIQAKTTVFKYQRQAA